MYHIFTERDIPLKTSEPFFKKVKQILAIIGIVVLAGLYVSTIVCALSSSDNFMNLLLASIYATVIIPVLIWAYSFIYKLLKKSKMLTKRNNCLLRRLGLF